MADVDVWTRRLTGRNRELETLEAFLGEATESRATLLTSGGLVDAAAASSADEFVLRGAGGAHMNELRPHAAATHSNPSTSWRRR